MAARSPAKRAATSARGALGARRAPGDWGWPIARPSGDGRQARVGIFSDSYLPRISGVVRSIESFVAELRREGHHASIFAPAYRGYVDADPEVIRFPSVRAPGVPDFPLAIPITARFIAKLRRRRLTVVHTHSPFMMGRAGEYAARRLRLPLIFTHHTMYSEYVHYMPILSQQFSRDVVTRYTVRYCNRCTLVISPSHAVKSWLTSIGVTAPIEVLATAGLELERYARLDPSWVRVTYGIPTDAPLVITVGRLAREKRFDVLLAAFAEAALGGPARLLVVGGGPQEAELQAIAGRLGVREQVVFSGPLPHARVLECYAAADLFAFASPTETQGLVVVEAMAAGLPVIAVRAGGVAEVVRDGETGRLVALNARALAGAIRHALEDPDFRRRCGDSGRRAAHAYAIDAIVHRLVTLYQRVSMLPSVVAAPD